MGMCGPGVGLVPTSAALLMYTAWCACTSVKCAKPFQMLGIYAISIITRPLLTTTAGVDFLAHGCSFAPKSE